MKKSLLFGCLGLMALGFTSCNSDNDYSSVTNTIILGYNLFTPVDGNGTPFVGSGTYNMTIKYPESTITLSATNMATPTGVSATFKTLPMGFVTNYIVIDETSRESITFKSADPSDVGSKIYNLNANVTNAIYFPPKFEDLDALPGYKWFVPTQSIHHLFMQYQFGDNWNVRTFWPDMTYQGQTITSYPQASEPYSTVGVKYRVIMNVKEDFSIGKTADVIMYDAKFAAPQPEISYIVLKGLDLQFNENGYTVSGTNVVPYMVEGGEYIEVPRYMFNDFNASVSGDMTGVKMSFTVAGVYTGEFSGTCLIK